VAEESQAHAKLTPDGSLAAFFPHPKSVSVNTFGAREMYRARVLNSCSDDMTVPTVAEIRAQMAVLQSPIYQVAAAVEHHPARLGGMLSGRIPMPPELALRLQRLLQEWSQQRRMPMVVLTESVQPQPRPPKPGGVPIHS
jgi:hypothetical protein